MEHITIISHLTPAEWKMSWAEKVVEDTRENMRAYQQSTCYWGHFKNDQDFVICHHKEFEVKSMSLGMYFTGRVEPYEKGSRITGKFGKKLSANLFLAMGSVLCLVALFGSMVRADREVMIVSAALFVVLFLCYLAKPRKGQRLIHEQLEKISFDEKFHGKKPPRKKRTMKEKASVKIENENAQD